MLISLALIFVCGLIFGNLFQKLKIPKLVGMLVAGILLGPYGFDLLSESILEISSSLKQIALVIIITRAGLSLELSDLKQIGRPAIMMSFIPACFEIFGVFIMAQFLFNFSFLDSLILGAITASSSPAVIVPRMINLIDNGYGVDKKIPQLILAGDSVDDVFNIVLFTALIGVTQNSETNVLEKFIQIPFSLIIGIIVGICIGFVYNMIFSKVKIDKIYKVLIILSISFFLIFIEDIIIIPFSGLLAIMSFGVTILKLNKEEAKEIQNSYKPLWLVFEILLFVLVGASVNINYFTTSTFKTIILLSTVLFIRGIGILICLIKTNLNKKEKLYTTLTGIPKATVQAAIGGIPLALGLLNGEIFLAISVICILITAPIGAFLLDISYKKLLTKKE